MATHAKPTTHVKLEEAVITAAAAVVVTNPGAPLASAKLTHLHPSAAAQPHYHKGGSQPFFAHPHAHKHHHPQHNHSHYNHHSSHAASSHTHSHG